MRFENIYYAKLAEHRSVLTEEEFSELFYRGIEYYFVAHP
jgi:hypothetical protein